MLRALARWKGIFLILTALLVIGLVLSRIVGPGTTPSGAEVSTSAADASNHIGKRAEVCGIVVEVTHIPAIDGEPTFLNFEEAHPDQPFTAVIWGRHRHQWHPAPEQQFTQQHLCVTGALELHEGTPQIETRDPGQIRIR